MSKYKDLFYDSVPKGSKYRQLGAVLFRTYKDDPEKAYKILMCFKDQEQDIERLLRYIDKPHFKEKRADFVDFYVKYRITIPNHNGLRYIYKSKEGALSRQLGDILYRIYGNNPDKIYYVLQNLTDEQDIERLLKYISKPYIKTKNVVKDFINTYMLYRVTLQDPRLKQIYMQNNLALLYPELDPTSKEARLKAIRKIDLSQPIEEETFDAVTTEETPDAATHDKMQEFYQNLFAEEKSHRFNFIRNIFHRQK